MMFVILLSWLLQATAALETRAHSVFTSDKLILSHVLTQWLLNLVHTEDIDVLCACKAGWPPVKCHVRLPVQL